MLSPSRFHNASRKSEVRLMGWMQYSSESLNTIFQLLHLWRMPMIGFLDSIQMILVLSLRKLEQLFLPQEVKAEKEPKCISYNQFRSERWRCCLSKEPKSKFSGGVKMGRNLIKMETWLMSRLKRNFFHFWMNLESGFKRRSKNDWSTMILRILFILTQMLNIKDNLFLTEEMRTLYFLRNMKKGV